LHIFIHVEAIIYDDNEKTASTQNPLDNFNYSTVHQCYKTKITIIAVKYGRRPGVQQSEVNRLVFLSKIPATFGSILPCMIKPRLNITCVE
jgi:hypothetical protein